MSRTNEAAAPVGGRGSAFRDGVRTLTPGYFALVMATGIVSIAMLNHHVVALSVTLLWLGCIEYAVLVVLNIWRALAFRAELADDLSTAFLVLLVVAITVGLRAAVAVGAGPQEGRTHPAASAPVAVNAGPPPFERARIVTAPPLR